MAASNVALAREQVRTGYPPSSLRYDWLIACLLVLGACGGYVDLWAHTHVPKLETFFTPWHAVLYGSFVLRAAALTWVAVINHRKGYAWTRSMPRGYGLALLGAGIYLIGGVGDMLWHIFFGVEKSVEALLSPTHLILALGSVLISLGPLRSAWQRAQARELRGWRELGPLLLALLALLTEFMFFSTYADPFVTPWSAVSVQSSSQLAYLTQALGISGILVQSALLMGPLLLVVKRWRLPAGALTLVLTLLQVFVSVPGDTYYLLPVAFLTGVGADLLLFWLRPSAEQETAFRLFAFLLPVLLYLLYFLDLNILRGVAWSIHLWMGSIVLAGIVGLFLSFLLLPPSSMGAKGPPDA